MIVGEKQVLIVRITNKDTTINYNVDIFTGSEPKIIILAWGVC